MSGAQGALPKESKTATTYESVPGGENKTKTVVDSKEDQGMIQIDKLQDKVDDAAGKGGPPLVPEKMKTSWTSVLLGRAPPTIYIYIYIYIYTHIHCTNLHGNACV
jgi:hypothetical protein